jgi:hypothetical protein
MSHTLAEIAKPNGVDDVKTLYYAVGLWLDR